MKWIISLHFTPLRFTSHRARKSDAIEGSLEVFKWMFFGVAAISGLQMDSYLVGLNFALITKQLDPIASSTNRKETFNESLLDRGPFLSEKKYFVENVP